MDYTLTLTAQEVNTILAALGELPLKATLAVFGKIQEQVRSQQPQEKQS